MFVYKTSNTIISYALLDNVLILQIYERRRLVKNRQKGIMRNKSDNKFNTPYYVFHRYDRGNNNPRYRSRTSGFIFESVEYDSNESDALMSYIRCSSISLFIFTNKDGSITTQSGSTCWLPDDRVFDMGDNDYRVYTAQEVLDNDNLLLAVKYDDEFIYNNHFINNKEL